MKRILVAHDLGRAAANALARAIRLADRTGAALHVLHATDGGDAAALAARLEAEAGIAAEELASRPLDIAVAVSTAPAQEAILRMAAAIAADLIVLGAHGEPRLRDAIFGTTGTHVARHAPCPVLVVQGHAEAPYAKMLAAVGGLETAPALFEAAFDVAPAAELFAVHACAPALADTLADPAALAHRRDARQLELEKMIGALRPRPAEVRSTRDAHVLVEAGEAQSLIMRETEALAPDLIVLGTRRRTAYLGSHAVDTLFWSPRDVLVVPERETVPA